MTREETIRDLWRDVAAQDEATAAPPSPLGRCGFYCGACPTYVAGRCAGCDREHVKGDCFTRDCTKSRGLPLCPLCPDFPCGELMVRERATVLDRDWLRWKARQRKQGEE